MTPTTPALDPADLEALRGPLTGYCYRMLGSAADTDDAVQETLFRALRALDTFDPTRARLTTWVHRIATNVCLDQLRAAPRRMLFAAAPDSDGQLGEPLPAEHWIEPMPGRRLQLGLDPAAHAVHRDAVRLAVLAAFQWLPPRQRATLILRDVLAFSAAETAAILDTTVASVTSALQRARATIGAHRFEQVDAADPRDPTQQALVQRYVDAFEAHDVTALTAVLRDDARLSMPPFAWQVIGGERIAATITSTPDCAADRLVPTDVNGGPGLGQYRPDAKGVLRPFALVSLDLAGDRVAGITTFLDCTHRFGEFGLPELLERSGTDR